MVVKKMKRKVIKKTVRKVVKRKITARAPRRQRDGDGTFGGYKYDHHSCDPDVYYDEYGDEISDADWKRMSPKERYFHATGKYINDADWKRMSIKERNNLRAQWTWDEGKYVRKSKRDVYFDEFGNIIKYNVALLSPRELKRRMIEGDITILL